MIPVMTGFINAKKLTTPFQISAICARSIKRTTAEQVAMV
jgi:hypothetical protein